MTAEAKLVLVVEDEPAIRDVISDVLVDQGFRVLVAANGFEALHHLDVARPDVMVLDLLMPVMHGWAFMESYLEKTDDEPIPIVILSVNPALPRSFNRFGVRAVVAKPFDINLLLDAVEEACSSGQSQAA